MQKVQTSLFKGMCALTSMINKLVYQIPLLPVGNNMLQEATDAFAMVTNANTELNHRRRELIKPDLHNDYKHLCSSSIPITDQLFGDELPKQVKDLTEVNRIGKKVTTSTGSFSRSQFDSRNSRNYTSHSSSCGQGYHYGCKFFFRRAIQRLTSQTVTPKEDEARTNEVDRSSDHVSSNNVEVSMCNEFTAGRLKQFYSQWKLITSDHFILSRNKI